MIAQETAAAPTTRTEATATHKEGTASPSSNHSVAPWHLSVAAWYRGGPKPNLATMNLARAAGISDYPPASGRDRVRVLALAGLDVEEIIDAVPEMNPVDIAETMDRISDEVRSIWTLHLGGQTPVEIANETGISRAKVYWWLRKFGFTPNRRARYELTARQRSQVVKAFQTGEPMASIARRFGISYDQVRYAVKRHAEG